MKNLFIVICLTVFPVSAKASFSTNELVKLINTKNLTSIDEVIPHLPEELLLNYTLQYKGGGIQSASFKYPRAILFGENAKFIVTFNGSSDQAMYESLEILEFNDKLQEFELYEVSIPSSGKMAYPEKNPQTCMKCHATNESGKPFPIWGRYPFWSGVYGSSDDQLYGTEKQEYIKNSNFWKQHPRYKHLKDSPGSTLGPYSTVKLQTMSFRPNSNMGVLLARLNAKAIAKEAKKVQDFEKFLLLASPSFFHCKNQMTKAELEMLDKKLMISFLNESKTKRIPHKKYYDLENLADILGSNTFAWGQLTYGHLQSNGEITMQNKVTDPYFFDGFFKSTPNYVLSELAEAFFTKFPKLKKDYKVESLTKLSNNEPRLTKTDRDTKITQNMDSLGIPLALNKSSCENFISYVSQEFLK